MREKIAIEKSITLFREYDGKEAAIFLDMHERTLAGLRRAGNIWCVKKSARNISYLGIHIVDFIIKSANLWPNTQNENSSLENIGYLNEKVAQHGTERGTKIDKRAALRLAQQTLGKPNKS